MSLKFKLNKMYIGIGVISFLLSNQALAQDKNPESNSENEKTEVKNDVNPFLNLSSQVEDIHLKKKEKEGMLELVNTDIELKRRNFQKEILPFQMEIQKLKLQQELNSVQNEIDKNQREKEALALDIQKKKLEQKQLELQRKSFEKQQNSINDISIEEIQKRIDRAASDIVNKKDAKISELRKQKEKIIRDSNTFKLKLISNNSSGKYATIENKRGDIFNISEDDNVNDWSVEGIDEERNKVILRNGKKVEVLSFKSNVSLIKNNNHSFEESNDKDLPSIR